MENIAYDRPFPLQATDQTFLQKLHHELAGHKDFIKGEDKRLWSVQFGVRHYAGPVTYSIRNFLEKNKDVQQDLFFDYLEHSTCTFTKDIVKYRVRKNLSSSIVLDLIFLIQRARGVSASFPSKINKGLSSQYSLNVGLLPKKCVFFLSVTHSLSPMQ